jgi:hypothetical protein
MRSAILAWYQYPEPTGTEYFADDLSEPRQVVRLFNRAAQFRAHITAQGWRFLWKRYGLSGLLEINRESGWFDPEDDHAAAEQMFNRSSIAGYDPVSGLCRECYEEMVG